MTVQTERAQIEQTQTTSPEPDPALAEPWHLYLLRCGDGSLYAGIAKDVARRLAEHQNQGPKCAKYLRGRTPLALVYSIAARDRAEASRWENLLKQQRKSDKEALVAGTKHLHELLDKP